MKALAFSILLLSQLSFSQDIKSSRLHLELSGLYQRLKLETKASGTTKEVTSNLNIFTLSPAVNYFISPTLTGVLSFQTGLEPSEKISYSGFCMGLRKFWKNSTQRKFAKFPGITFKQYSQSGFYAGINLVRNTLASDATTLNFLGFSLESGYFKSLGEDYYLIGAVDINSLSGDKNRSLFSFGGKLSIGTFFY